MNGTENSCSTAAANVAYLNIRLIAYYKNKNATEFNWEHKSVCNVIQLYIFSNESYRFSIIDLLLTSHGALDKRGGGFCRNQNWGIIFKIHNKIYDSVFKFQEGSSQPCHFF